MDSMVAQNLRTYIEAELSDSELYKSVSEMAPSNDDRELLLEFSEDERSHAEMFKKLYRSITGRSYNPRVNPPALNGSYADILRDRVLDESGDFRKYGIQYLMTTNNNELKNAYYRAHLDENVHALRLLYMLSKIK